MSCHPAELHFRGFEPGQPLQHTVTLRNDSARQTRVIVVPPTSGSCFQASDSSQVTVKPAFDWHPLACMYNGSQVVEQLGGGRLAPGLCQQLVVQFTGQQLQHYQDSILVHTELCAY